MGDLVRYSGEHDDGYLPALVEGRVLSVGARRLIVRYPWGLHYPRIDNVTVCGHVEAAA